ncbi:hypothetical protein K8R04_01765 [Candidatus Uhrbacteria bacterium]|nr:hypothetical protein [Candidatus Uhrbacteria bacterium]
MSPDRTTELFCDEEVVEPRQDRRYPAWWKPSRFDGVLSRQELAEMANADARFLDEEAAT